MVLKEKVRIVWGLIFILLSLGLAIYFIILATNLAISEATTILALLTAVVALAVSLLNTVKLKKKWKK